MRNASRKQVITVQARCIDCGGEKELKKSHYCNECRDKLIMAKVRES